MERRSEKVRVEGERRVRVTVLFEGAETQTDRVPTTPAQNRGGDGLVRRCSPRSKQCRTGRKERKSESNEEGGKKRELRPKGRWYESGDRVVPTTKARRPSPQGRAAADEGGLPSLT